MFFYIFFILTEDQQAIEDEGLVIPMKPNVPIVNQYNRNPINYFQTPAQPATAFARPLPLYPANINNAPLAMMNYYNTPSHQHAPIMEHYQTGIHQQQKIPIDVVR